MMSMLSNVSMGRPCGMSSRSAAPRRGLVARPAIGNPETEGKRQADKAAYFEKQEELEKKNPEKARMESEMRNSKPPTGAYGTTNREKGAGLQNKEHMKEIDEENKK